jgi:hypothetical protein
MKRLYYFHDPGHGWIRVPISTLDRYGLRDKISPWSYKRKKYAYLEEDCDATLFQKTVEAVTGKPLSDTFSIVDVYQEYTPIRSYPDYTPER